MSLLSNISHKFVSSQTNKLRTVWDPEASQDKAAFEAVLKSEAEDLRQRLFQVEKDRPIIEIRPVGKSWSLTDWRNHDLDEFNRVAFPLVSRVFPQLLTNEITGVQPMKQPSGNVFFLDFKWDKHKAAPTHDFDVYDFGCDPVLGPFVVDESRRIVFQKTDPTGFALVLARATEG